MSEERTNVNSNREVKSDVFTTLFSEPENAAQLYTALSGVETSPGEIEITTLKGVLFLPPEETLKLSDAYLEKADKPMLELTVKMININLPVNHKILRECMPLYEYSWFMQKIRTYLEKEKSRDEAVTLAIRDCIQEGIFADFVKKHGSEVENMLFTQFNMEDALAVRYEEGVEDGIERGRAEGRMVGVAEGSTIKLIQQIQKKLQKGLTTEEIAEDLEEPLEKVLGVLKAIENSGTEDPGEIYKLLEADR